MTATTAPAGARERRAAWAFVLALVLLGAAYLACLDEVAGLFVDDAWYVVLAQALASGHGFTITSAPIPDVQPFYPPGFPALLALVFLVAPDFPANVVVLKAVSVVALLGAAVLARHYFLRLRGESPWLASGLALLVVANGFLHFLLTSAVLSEGFFLCVQMAAIVAVERVVGTARSGPRALGDVVLAAALVVATGLVRSIGMVLAPATLLYVLWRAGLRKAVLVAAAIAAVAAPWQIYSSLHRPTAEQRRIVNDPIVASYFEQLGQRRAAHAEFGREGLRDLPARLARNLDQLGRHTIGALYANPALERTRFAPLLSVILAAITLLGMVVVARARVTVVELYLPATLGVLVIFGAEADRYLLPVLPFLAHALVAGVALLVATAVRFMGLDGARGVRIGARAGAAVLALLLAIDVAGLARDVLDARGLRPGRRTAWRAAFAENLAVLDWVRERVPPETVLASHNPAMVYLFTGRRAVGTWEPAENIASWRAANVKYWVDNTVADYRFPDMEKSGLAPLMKTRWLRLGVYRIPPPGWPLR